MHCTFKYFFFQCRGEESLLEYSTVKTITIKLPQISNVSKTSDTTKTYDASSLKSKQKSVDLKLSWFKS